MLVKNEFIEKISNMRPSEWENLPDIQLYMDQVLLYMERQHIGLSLGEELTSAMVNNYIKKGLLPRAKGKRYEREHLAYLTMICLFKQILSVSATDNLLKLLIENTDTEDVYSRYRLELDEKLKETAEVLRMDYSEEERANLALSLAVNSYVSKLACEEIINYNIDNKENKNDVID
ncbi:MAG: DUF1836 domain-containing protein [Eubacteriales bacterium]|nr:DUF1836 domain-containing protein [Eubacteriales bacterium]MDD4389532.1 DUF1836 domain-containing protein [Eubacteriales bacterium]